MEEKEKDIEGARQILKRASRMKVTALTEQEMRMRTIAREVYEDEKKRGLFKTTSPEESKEDV